jgi:hypothetical protein
VSGSPFDSIHIPDEAWRQESTRKILQDRAAGPLFKFAQKYGISQPRLAAATGIQQARINDLIKGRRKNITALDTWERIAEGLNMPNHARITLGLAPREVANSERFGISPDDKERLSLSIQRPSRLDSGVVDTLSTVLAGQRRLEDAIGPAALILPSVAQLQTISAMLREASGPHRDELARVVAEWTVFTGWLHAALRQDDDAIALFNQAQDLSDDVGYGVGAALATSFTGYVARQQDRPRAVIRAASAAMETPGVHPAQKTYDKLQAAQGYARLGDKETVRRLLDQAVDLASTAGDPPEPVYWYSEPFFQLNIGMTQHGVGNHRDAVALIQAGLDNLPADQRAAEWLQEYKQALTEAKELA